MLASINPGNDLAEVITTERVGRVCTDHSVDTRQRLAEELLQDIASQGDMPARCGALPARLFSRVTAVRQMVAAPGSAEDAPDAVFKG